MQKYLYLKVIKISKFQTRRVSVSSLFDNMEFHFDRLMTHHLKLLDIIFISSIPYHKYTLVIAFGPIKLNAFIQYFDKYNWTERRPWQSKKKDKRFIEIIHFAFTKSGSKRFIKHASNKRQVFNIYIFIH